MKTPVPAPLRSAPFKMSSVFTSPPVVIDAPGRSVSKAIRSMAPVPFETSGPESSLSWKPRMSPIWPLLIVIWPMFEHVGPVRLAVGVTVRVSRPSAASPSGLIESWVFEVEPSTMMPTRPPDIG